MHSTTDDLSWVVVGWAVGVGLLAPVLALSTACRPSGDDPAATGVETTTTTGVDVEGCLDFIRQLANGPLDDLDVPSHATICPGTVHDYVFTLAYANYFIGEARFDRQLGNLKMSVLDDANNVLWSSTGGDLAVIHRLLPAGPYVLRLENIEGTLPYFLRVRALPTQN